jgi:hypothetical protein
MRNANIKNKIIDQVQSRTTTWVGKERRTDHRFHSKVQVRFAYGITGRVDLRGKSEDYLKFAGL